MSFLVESPGLLTTFQDLGRRGYQHLGVSPGGAMDEVSHRMANLLVGNPVEAASMEITLAGPILHVDCDGLIALCGGDLSPTIEGQAVPLWRPVMVRRGSRLIFGRPVKGARAYLAVHGGFRLPSVMKSGSTHLAAGFGGFHGRALKAGDRLDIEPPSRAPYPALQRRFQEEGGPFLAPEWFVPWFREMDFARPSILRIIPGPQWPSLTSDSRARLLEDTFRVATDSNRMGLRLQGPKLSLELPMEMLSAGVAMGTIQLPPDGAPILLMADRQTTGGYPRIGELASVDLPKAAQLRPGDTLRFTTLSPEEAQTLYLSREARFAELARILAHRRNL